MEAKTKSNDEEKKHEEKTSKSFEDVREHDHINAQLWELPHKEH